MGHLDETKDKELLSDLNDKFDIQPFLLKEANETKEFNEPY